MRSDQIMTTAVDRLIDPDDLSALQQARELLEHPGLVIRISNAVGRPIEKSIDYLPKSWSKVVHTSAHKAIEKALDVAVGSLNVGKAGRASDRLHQIAATVSGGAGGAFGLLAVSVELPISTTIMLRSIADIARSEGEDLNQTEARVQCVQVLALGGPTSQDDGVETAYFTARAAMARAVSEAASHIASKGLAEKSAPAVVRLISQVAARFSVVVSEKAAAQALPIIGALGGAVINSIFITHFQDMARGHFIVRRLERKYGPELIQSTYERMRVDSLPELMAREGLDSK